MELYLPHAIFDSLAAGSAKLAQFAGQTFRPNSAVSQASGGSPTADNGGRGAAHFSPPVMDGQSTATEVASALASGSASPRSRSTSQRTLTVAVAGGPPPEGQLCRWGVVVALCLAYQQPDGRADREEDSPHIDPGGHAALAALSPRRTALQTKRARGSSGAGLSGAPASRQQSALHSLGPASAKVQCVVRDACVLLRWAYKKKK